MSGGVVAACPDQQRSVGSRPEAQLSLEVRRDLDWLPSDLAALDALITTRPQVGVFLCRAWLSGFFAHPPPACEPLLLVLLERGALRGIVAIGLRRSVTHVAVRLLGGGIGSDRTDLLAARGYEVIFSDMFLDWLERSFGPKGYFLELRDVPGDSPLWGAIWRASAERKFPLTLVPRDVHAFPYLALDKQRQGSEADLLSPSAGKSLARHRRLLERRGALSINVLQNADDVLAAFDELVRLLHARWGSASALADVRVRRFHRYVLPLLLREGRLRMIRLTAEARPIAMFYGFAIGSWWGYYLAGYDREWAGRIRLGQITLASAIELSLQEGAAEFDFLKGAERIKYHWSVRERVTVDADVYSRTCGAQWIRTARATREAAGALVRTAQGLFMSRDHAGRMTSEPQR